MIIELTKDADGHEMRVECGVGTIVEVTPKPRNVGVVIAVPGRDERDPVWGWIDSYNAPADIIARLRAGELVGHRVEFRIEIQRTRGINPDIPLAEVSYSDRIRELAILRVLGDDPTATAATIADEPPTSSTPPESGFPAPVGEIADDPTRYVAEQLMRAANAAAGSAASLLRGTDVGTELLLIAAKLSALADGVA